jgi:hypothetical protein
MKKKRLLILVLASMLAVEGNAHVPNSNETTPHTDFTLAVVLLSPMGKMSDDIRSKPHFEVGIARQILETPFHIGFHMGLGTYGSYKEDILYFEGDGWVDAPMEVNDNSRTIFASLRYDFLRDTRFVPYVQAKFGNYRMSTRMVIHESNSDPNCPKDYMNELMHADNTWMYGGAVGFRFQPYINKSDGRERFTIDWYVGMMRGGNISYSALHAPHGGSVVGETVQIGDDVFEVRDADWIENYYYGTYLYNNLLNNIEAGIKVGVRF